MVELPQNSIFIAISDQRSVHKSHKPCTLTISRVQNRTQKAGADIFVWTQKIRGLLPDLHAVLLTSTMLQCTQCRQHLSSAPCPNKLSWAHRHLAHHRRCCAVLRFYHCYASARFFTSGAWHYIPTVLVNERRSTTILDFLSSPFFSSTRRLLIVCRRSKHKQHKRSVKTSSSEGGNGSPLHSSSILS